MRISNLLELLEERFSVDDWIGRLDALLRSPTCLVGSKRLMIEDPMTTKAMTMLRAMRGLGPDEMLDLAL
jgi:hypothetical protein